MIHRDWLKVSAIRKEPFTLPAAFAWSDIALSDGKQLEELYNLLNENYVEDDDNMFRFDYSPEFLKWFLPPFRSLPPVRSQVGCVEGPEAARVAPGVARGRPRCQEQQARRLHRRHPRHRPHLRPVRPPPPPLRASAALGLRPQKMVEINFLCVHKRLRAKKVAPVLIKEITRRVNLTGLFQAVYTAGVVLPRPVATCRFPLLAFELNKVAQWVFLKFLTPFFSFLVSY